jgi:hypothetical protein
MTLCESDRTIIFDIRENSNTQWDFLLFLLYCMQKINLFFIYTEIISNIYTKDQFLF